MKFVKSEIMDLTIESVLQPVPRLVVCLLEGDESVHKVRKGVDTPLFLYFPTRLV